MGPGCARTRILSPRPSCMWPGSRSSAPSSPSWSPSAFGDTIIKGDLAALFRSDPSVAGVKEVEDPRRLGVVELDERGDVVHFIEKPDYPPTNLALIGVYYLQHSDRLRDALDRLVREDRRSRGEFWLADGLQLMVEAGERMRTFPLDHWYDCGTAEALLLANRDLLDLAPPGQG